MSSNQQLRRQNTKQSKNFILQRAGLAPVIAEKLKAEKASIERMVKDAEAQLASKLLQVKLRPSRNGL